MARTDGHRITWRRGDTRLEYPAETLAHVSRYVVAEAAAEPCLARNLILNHKAGVASDVIAKPIPCEVRPVALPDAVGLHSDCGWEVRRTT
jgi:hypothetical protein